MSIDPVFLPFVYAGFGAGITALVLILVVWVCARKINSLKAQCIDMESQYRVLELESSGVKVGAEEKEKALAQALAQIGRLELELADESASRQAAQRDSEVASVRLKERELGFTKQLEQFEEQKESLKKEFELLAHRIFEQKGKAFEVQSKTNLGAVLQPFKEQIEGFQNRVNQVHSESVQGQTKLEQQIKSVLDVGLKMSDEANTLASALKGDKKAQGTWSEVQAELLLEMAGLSEGREYEREANFKSDDGRDQRPDFIIQLPNDKHIILDSKISLNAYVQATGADTEEDRAKFMRLHVEAIRNHVKSLSDKNYPKLKGINSPEYVFMFIGNEPAYLSAADFDATLFQEAYRKGIAIVTPNTLLSSLRIVSHLWSIDKQNSNTRKLADQASKVYDKLRVFVSKVEKLGTQINTVQKSYDDTWTTLKGGRGSLAKQVESFVEMGVTVKEKLPNSVTGDAELGLSEDSE